MSVSKLLETFGVTLGIYGLYKLAQLAYGELTSPFRHFPGPPSADFLMGNLRQVLGPDQLSTHEEWIQAYGPTIKYRSIFWRNRLYTSDTKAINHMLMNNFIYQKPEIATYGLKRILGESILVTETEVHKKQRKILNPAFGPLQIQELTEIFVDKAIQLREIWVSQVQKSKGEARVDVLPWIDKLTLDVIGQAGFGYNFGALSDNPEQKNELFDALTTMSNAGSQPSLLELLQAIFPVLRFLSSENDAKNKRASEVMFRVGKELLEKSKRDHFEQHIKGRTNLLSLLVRANISSDIPEHQRLSDEDVVAQIPTFIVAGHETTSAATAWALFSLAKDKAIQEKLREELLTVSTDNPTMQELNSLPYLDTVVRETLRLYAPVSATSREAVEDDVLPLETPVTDKKGKIHYDVRIMKSQKIVIPITLINRSKTIWGEDAHEFRPERWHSVPQAAASVPGIWGNMLTFLGGPRACIGYRFSLVETKAILFTLFRAFEFDLAVPHQDIIKKSEFIARPALKTDPQGGRQLPVLIRPTSPF